MRMTHVPRLSPVTQGSTDGPTQPAPCPAAGRPITTAAAPLVAVSGGLSFATVSAGYKFACGVTTSGAAYCWGSNVFGQLGNGSTTNSLTRVAISGGLSF